MRADSSCASLRQEVLIALGAVRTVDSLSSSGFQWLLPDKIQDALFDRPRRTANLRAMVEAPESALPLHEAGPEIESRIARIPGAVDVHIHQVVNYPEIRVNVDRNKAGQVGLTQRDVSSSMLIAM